MLQAGKVLRKAPPLIAKGIAEGIADAPLFEKVEQVNAYVNMFISKEEFVKDTLEEVLAKGDDFGRTDIGAGKKVIVEYSSPNIAKPFHIGHIRSTGHRKLHLQNLRRAWVRGGQNQPSR